LHRIHSLFFLSGGAATEEGTAQKLCGERRLSIALHPPALRLIYKSLRSKRSDDSERAFASFPNSCRIRRGKNFGGKTTCPFRAGRRSDSALLPGYF